MLYVDISRNICIYRTIRELMFVREKFRIEINTLIDRLRNSIQYDYSIKHCSI